MMCFVNAIFVSNLVDLVVDLVVDCGGGGGGGNGETTSTVSLFAAAGERRGTVTASDFYRQPDERQPQPQPQ
jgi:hypothetical protein